MGCKGYWQWATLTFIALLFAAGCSSSDNSTGSGGDGSEETGYLLEGYFGGAVAEGGFGLWVGRLDPQYASAQDCQVTVNGQDINLMGLISTDDDAFFAALTYEYQAGTQYTISAALGGRSATCSFTGPSYSWITITAPVSDLFVPGDPLELVWEYDDGTPDQVYITASVTSGDEELILLETGQNGSIASYTISGDVTALWDDYTDILVTVDGGEDAWPFTGDLTALGSAVYTVLPGDAIIINPGEEPQVTWTLALRLDAEALDADGVSTTTAHVAIEDEFLNDCPDGTEVAFSADPAGVVTFDPVTAETLGGEATTTITAGSQSAEATITATGLGEQDTASLTLETPLQLMVGSGDFPQIIWAPNENMLELLVRERQLEIGSLLWSITGIFGSPVTYGDPPDGSAQTWPLLGNTPAALATGVDYRILIVDTVGDTTAMDFTR